MLVPPPPWLGRVALRSIEGPLGRPTPTATVDDLAAGRVSIGAHSYTDERIQALETIAGWDWPVEQGLEAVAEWKTVAAT